MAVRLKITSRSAGAIRHVGSTTRQVGPAAIAKALGASEKDLLLGEQASEPMLRQLALDRYRIVEFATHGC